WPFAEVGFCVTTSGKMLAPPMFSPPMTNSLACVSFYRDNGAFLGNQESAEVYWSQIPNRAGNSAFTYNNYNTTRKDFDSSTKNEGTLRNGSQAQQPLESPTPSSQKQDLPQIVTANESSDRSANGWNPLNNLKVVSRKVSPLQQSVQSA